MLVVVSPGPEGFSVTRLDDAGTVLEAPVELTAEQYARLTADDGPAGARWVWEDTAIAYPPLLQAGVRIERCHDLRLSRAILRGSTRTRSSELASAPIDALDGGSPLRG